MAATSIERNKEIARKIPEDVATEGNVDVLDEVLADDFVEHSFVGEVRGKEEAKANMQRIAGSFSDHTATVEDIVAEGDTVAMRVTLRGKHTGEFMGMEPTGKEFEISNKVFTRIEDGKIAERWLTTDALTMLTQLGLIESPIPERA